LEKTFAGLVAGVTTSAAMRDSGINEHFYHWKNASDERKIPWKWGKTVSLFTMRLHSSLVSLRTEA